MKKISLFALLLTSNISYSQSSPEFFEAEPPETCVFGKSRNIVVGGGFLDNDYLEIDIPTYLLVDHNVKAKADNLYLLSNGDEVFFYDSLGGYRGSDKADIEGNAYLNYTVSREIRSYLGAGFAWVIKGLPSNGAGPVDSPIPDFCSKKAVYFQNEPSVNTTKTQYTSGNRVEGTIYISGYQDPYYSKNAHNGQAVQYEVQRKAIGSTWVGSVCDIDDYAPWETARALSTSESFSFSNLSCMVQYRIRSFDGTYTSDWSYETVVNTPPTSGSSSSSSSSSSSGSSSSSSGGSCNGPFCTIEP